MTDETAQALTQAQEAEERQRGVVDELKRECAESVADAIPPLADKYAKKLAHEQPDVTRTLGKDGVDALRRELAAAAEHLGTELREGVDAIGWPEGKSRVTMDNIHTALFNFMYGARVNRLTAIFRSHGYFFEEHGGILPQDLYDLRDATANLASAIEEHAKLASFARTAKAADDRATVDSLWED